MELLVVLSVCTFARLVRGNIVRLMLSSTNWLRPVCVHGSPRTYVPLSLLPPVSMQRNAYTMAMMSRRKLDLAMVRSALHYLRLMLQEILGETT